MAVKVLETQLKIGAKDNTGGTFDLVAQKMRHLEQAALSANRRMDGLARGMSSPHWRRQAEFQAGIVNRMSQAAPVVARGATITRGMNGRLSAAKTALGDFASYAAPGAIGGALGLGGAAVGGLAVGGAAAYGVHQAVTFDKAMADVRKKVNLEAGQTIDDVENMINKTARNIGVAREEVAALAAQAGQSGIAFGDMAEFMNIAAKASSAWDISAKESAQTMAEIRAKTGWSNKELEAYADKVNYLGDISAAAEKNISTMWSKASSGAKAAGVSYDDAMVMLTAMRSVGMQEDVAARAFGQFSSRLRNATSLPKRAQTAFKQLGVNPAQLEKGMQTDAMGTMLNFMERLSKSKDKAKIATGFGGQEWWDEFLLMADSSPETRRLKNALDSGQSKGSLNKSQAIDKSTTANHMTRFSNLMSEVGDRASRRILPTVNSIMEGMLSRYDKGASIFDFDSGESSNLVLDRMRGMRATGLDRTKAMGFFPATSFQSEFRLGKKSGWASGEQSQTVAPGALAFGLGGVGDISSLQVAPHNPAAVARATLAESAAALRTAPPPPVKLEGAANIDLKVVVEAAADFLTKVEQTIAARGALRSDTGVSMAP